MQWDIIASVNVLILLTVFIFVTFQLKTLGHCFPPMFTVSYCESGHDMHACTDGNRHQNQKARP